MNENYQHVQHISKIMKNTCTLVMALVGVAMVLIWSNFEAARAIGFFHRLPDQTDNLTMLNYLGGILVSGAMALLVIVAIYHLRNFFKLNSEGKMFNAEGANSLHRFAKYIIFYSCLSIPAETLLSLIMTFNNPVGERMIIASFQTYDFTLIFLSFVLLAVSWVIKQSVELAEENAQFV